MAGERANELGHATLLDPVGSRSEHTSDEYSCRTDGEDQVRCDPWKYLGSKNTWHREAETTKG